MKTTQQHENKSIISEQNLEGKYFGYPIAGLIIIVGAIFLFIQFMNFKISKISSISIPFSLILIGIGLFFAGRYNTQLREFKIDGSGIKFWYNGELDFSAEWKDIEMIGTVKRDNYFSYGIEILPKDYEVSARIKINSDVIIKAVFKKMIWYAKKNNVKIKDELKVYIT